MKPEVLKQVSQLQQIPSQIRNICILAHVDHGKTTLADSLVASNGIISKRNIGKMRYMDSRPDEQERGITMKSSAITLIYAKKPSNSNSDPESFLINLIDSPGHVDFSSEVTTAVRLCDGAIVVVDVVEGVCPQTHAVLRQAWLENIRPVLVLNKLDRLMSQLKLTPTEAYQHLIKILEQVNLLTNQLFTSEAMERTSQQNEEDETDASSAEKTYDWTIIEDEEDNNNIFFSPDQGNVVFASALDGWGFTMQDFASMYATKLGVNKQVLTKTLWGDYYINMKAKRLVKGAQSKGKKPLFVQFVLDNIWAVYDSVIEKKDSEMTNKIVKSLGVVLQHRDTYQKDPKVLLKAIMCQWLPLADTVLSIVCSCIPSPLEISEEKVERLMCNRTKNFSSLPTTTQNLKKDFQECNPSETAPVIIFISKLLPIAKQNLPQTKISMMTDEQLQKRREEVRGRYAAKLSENSSQSNIASEKVVSIDSVEKQEEETDKMDHVFIALGRVFSGTVRKGTTLYFLAPKHDPAAVIADLSDVTAEELLSREDLQQKCEHVKTVVVKDLYVMMGRDLESVDEVPPGNILGIGGVDEGFPKSGTLSSTVACPAFTDMYFDVAPIVRVAVEPVEAGDMDKLVIGLKLLNQADPCVDVRVQETGEHVIIAAGEVHLQRCIDDLKEMYAKIEVNVSKPIVPFRETIIVQPQIDMVNESIAEQVPGEEEKEPDEPIQASTADRQGHLLLQAAPLPEAVAELLWKNHQTLKDFDSFQNCLPAGQTNDDANINDSIRKAIMELKQQLKQEFEKSGPEWAGAEEHIWSFGPRRCGPNILLNGVKQYHRQSVWDIVEKQSTELKLEEFDNSIVTGFQLATLAGPLCEEPLYGVCFVVKDWWYGEKRTDNSMSTGNQEYTTEKEDTHICKTKVEKQDCDMTLNDVCVNGMESNHSEPDCLNEDSDEAKNSSSLIGSANIERYRQVYGPLSGQFISTMKDGCRRAFQSQPQRLMVALYQCEVQATMEVLGKLYGVLSKRFGQVLSEELQEGTDIFVVTAALPVIESFGFAEDIRKKTSGLASPQLKFSHWSLLPVDPFWVPTTEEEYMHFGEKADAENRARLYMNQIRKRKGLKRDEQIVEFAEKQRNLTKMK